MKRPKNTLTQVHVAQDSSSIHRFDVPQKPQQNLDFSQLTCNRDLGNSRIRWNLTSSVSDLPTIRQVKRRPSFSSGKSWFFAAIRVQRESHVRCRQSRL